MMRRSGRTRRAVEHYGQSETEAEPHRKSRPRRSLAKYSTRPSVDELLLKLRVPQSHRDFLKTVEFSLKFDTYEDVSEKLKEVVLELKGHSGSWPFLEPAPASVPLYYQVALRERRIHVTIEDFEMAVSKVMKKDADQDMSVRKLFK